MQIVNTETGKKESIFLKEVFQIICADSHAKKAMINFPPFEWELDLVDCLHHINYGK